MNIGAYLITTKRQHDRCELIKKTWGSKMLDSDELYFFTDTEGPSENYIKVTDNTKYSSHGIKQIECFLFAKKQNNIDWFFIGSDDNYVFVNTLKDFCSKQDSSKPFLFGAFANTFGNDPSLYYPLGGAGYILNKKAIDLFVEENPKMLENYKKGLGKDSKCNWVDVYIGYLLKESKINLVTENNLMRAQKTLDIILNELENNEYKLKYDFYN